MSEFSSKLVDTCWTAIEPILRKSHQPVMFRAVRDLLMVLRQAHRSRSSRIPISDFEAIRDEVAERNAVSQPGDLAAQAFAGRYHLYTKDDEATLRLTERGDLECHAMFSGMEIICAETERLMLRRLGHNYILLYPELLPLLRLFAPPGDRKAVVSQRANHFVFCRKINQVTAEYLFDEARDFGFLVCADSDTERYTLGRLPAPAIAYLACGAYLDLSGMRLDLGVRTRDLEMQLRFLGPDLRVAGPWQSELRDVPLLRLELGGAQVRITDEAFLWLAGHRMVEPTTVGQLLVAMQCLDDSAKLRDQMVDRINGLQPVNAIAYLGAFGSASGTH